MMRTSRNVTIGVIVTVALATTRWAASADPVRAERTDRAPRPAAAVLDWNQIFIDT
jgi:hypothetical protein